MAERFARGGRLVALGRSPAARSDARHVAVEFVHPVIVGKRALPAIGARAPRAARSAAQVGLLAEPDDIAIGFGADEPERRDASRRSRLARERGCLTIAFAPPAPSGSSSRRRRRPVRPPGAGRDALPRALGARPRLLRPPRPARAAASARPVHDAGASSFLYPFLSEAETDLDAVIDDVRALGADQGGGGRRAARADAGREPRGPARGRGRRCARASTPAASCSRSATAARRPTRWTWSPTSATRRRPLAAAPRDRPHRGPSILTAIANDVGVERDLPAPGDRLRARGRRAGRALDQRQLREPDRGARRGAAARAGDDRDGRLRRRAGSPPRASPTTSSSPARSTSRGSRRRRRAPTTCCASWSSWARADGGARRRPPRARRASRAPGHGHRPGRRLPARSSSGSRASSGSAGGCSTTSAAC